MIYPSKTKHLCQWVVIVLFSGVLFGCGVSPVAIKNPPKPSSPLVIDSIDVLAFYPELSISDLSNYRNELTELYQLTGSTPAWFNQSKLLPQADTAIKLLENAFLNGLNPLDYEADKLRNSWLDLIAVDTVPVEEQLQFDTYLSANFIRYMHELSYGRIDAQSLDFGFDVNKKKHNANQASLLFKSIQNNNLNELVTELEPDLNLYRILKKKLAKYRQLSTQPKISIPGSNQDGESFNRIWQIKRLLTVVGDYHSDENDSLKSETEEKIYADKMLSAIKKFQRRHGLDSDGIIGKETLVAMNSPFEHRVMQLELAMERLRWLPNLNDSRFIVVNIPAFKLWAFDSNNAEGKYSLTMKVVVGEALDKQTPVFMANMKYLDFRPYWNIPYSIAVKELLPDLAQAPEVYLSEHNMEFVHRFGNDAPAIELNQKSLDLLRKGELKLRQRPGKNNALGKVKFIFPNKNAIYLHDTPGQNLFARSRRDFSHGCIRVEDPENLAAFVLQSQSGWDRISISKAMNSGNTQRIHLAQPIPVIIFYTTAFAEPDGTVSFFDDIYGHDKVLNKALSERTLTKMLAISEIVQ